MFIYTIHIQKTHSLHPFFPTINPTAIMETHPSPPKKTTLHEFKKEDRGTCDDCPSLPLQKFESESSAWSLRKSCHGHDVARGE